MNYGLDVNDALPESDALDIDIDAFDANTRHKFKVHLLDWVAQNYSGESCAFKRRQS